MKLSPIKEPRTIQLRYYRQLKALANELKKAVREEIIPELKDTKIVNDSVLSVLTALETIRRRFTNIDFFANQASSELVESINQNGRERFLNTANNMMGVDLSRVIQENNLSDIVALQKSKNKVLIKSIPEEFLKEVEVVVTNGISQGLRPEAIARQLSGIKNISSTFGKLENRVKLIARNEVATINANLNKARYQNVGIDLYEWSTSGDERVRDSHEVMDGKICTFKDDTVYADTIDDARKGKWKKRSSIGAVEKSPGIEINCRCNSLPIFLED